MNRVTIKEIRRWMKTLEENRYRKIVNADARRVAWFVNNSLSEDYDTMPESMRKKWVKAEYKKERYLAKEFMKSQKAKLKKNSLAHKLYKKTNIFERHRHRYEVNPEYISELEKKGLLISARSEIHNLVEIIGIKDHPWYLGCQFHPEFTSKPKTGHPLFNDFIKTAVKLKR